MTNIKNSKYYLKNPNKHSTQEISMKIIKCTVQNTSNTKILSKDKAIDDARGMHKAVS